MTPWTELDHDGGRIRYRRDDLDHAHPPAAYQVEWWHPARQEWRRVVNWSSRDWFVIGLEAGRREVLGEVRRRAGERAA